MLGPVLMCLSLGLAAGVVAPAAGELEWLKQNVVPIREGIESEHYALTEVVWAGIRKRGRALARRLKK